MATFPMPLWHFRYLLRAPHRLAFFMGAVTLGASALWWAGVLLARALQWPLNPVVPASLMHALVFSLSYMPLFFCGFLYTVGPKWLKQPAVSARSLLPALALHTQRRSRHQPAAHGANLVSSCVSLRYSEKRGALAG